MLRYNNKSCQVFFLALKTNRKAIQIPLQDLSTGEVFFASIYIIEQQKEIGIGNPLQAQCFDRVLSQNEVQSIYDGNYDDWISKNLVVENVDFGLGPGTVDITLHNTDESFERSGETFFNDLDNQNMEGTIIE